MKIKPEVPVVWSLLFYIVTCISKMCCDRAKSGMND